MTYEEFIEDINRMIEERPPYFRKGQAVYNYIHEKYGVSDDIQHYDDVDCFYRDQDIDLFCQLAYKRIMNND